MVINMQIESCALISTCINQNVCVCVCIIDTSLQQLSSIHFDVMCVCVRLLECVAMCVMEYFHVEGRHVRPSVAMVIVLWTQQSNSHTIRP